MRTVDRLARVRHKPVSPSCARADRRPCLPQERRLREILLPAATDLCERPWSGRCKTWWFRRPAALARRTAPLPGPRWSAFRIDTRSSQQHIRRCRSEWAPSAGPAIPDRRCSRHRRRPRLRMLPPRCRHFCPRAIGPAEAFRLQLSSRMAMRLGYLATGGLQPLPGPVGGAAVDDDDLRPQCLLRSGSKPARRCLRPR